MISETQPADELIAGQAARHPEKPGADSPTALLVKLATRGSSFGRIRNALRTTADEDVIRAVDSILDHMRHDNCVRQGWLQLFLDELSDQTFPLLFSQGNPKQRLRRLAAAGIKLPFDERAIYSPAEIVDWQSAIGRSMAYHLDPRTWRPFLEQMEGHHSYICRDTILLWQSLGRALLRSAGRGCRALHYVDAVGDLSHVWQARLTVAATLTADSASLAFLTTLATTGYLHESGLRHALAELGQESVVREAFRETGIPAWQLRALESPVISRLHFRPGVIRHLRRHRCAMPLEQAGLLSVFGVSVADQNATILDHAADAQEFLDAIEARDPTPLYEFVDKQHRNDVAAILAAGDAHLLETQTEHDLWWLVDHRADIVNFFRSRGIEERAVFPTVFQSAAKTG